MSWNEKDQIMTSNVWLKQLWNDYRLAWNPDDYDGLGILRVPSQMIWLPDIVLFNNADGNYEVTLMTKALVYANGDVYWLPPAIYKSSCKIDVQYFPFDEQRCIMKYGSWTYDGYLVDLVLINEQIDLEDYWESGEWSLVDTPGVRNTVKYACCDTINVDITFTIHIMRKPLFYTVNLIIPCVLISFLTVLVFYLPSDCGEKITLCISVLLALTVFLLLISDIIPPTSLVIPLIGRYLLFTMVLVTVSIIVTVIVLNIHHRAPSTHTMSPWIRKVFLEILPPLLLMKRQSKNKGSGGRRRDRRLPPCVRSRNAKWWHRAARDVAPHFEHVRRRHVQREQAWPRAGGQMPRPQKPVDARFKEAIRGVNYVAQHLKNEDEFETISEDWKYVAMVVDRIFLWIFLVVVLSGTAGILLSAPTIYMDRKVLG
uniref:Acetylcholine receptor subunit alpha-like 1-like n=1 Tax=Saccoglossus kowalevskii TaxID=10224 RepID=A0ABM0LV99_SACKO|nr:PREDICTED: acetylcholine receptor subunit alpha-like 1-like [Saccoglossus kowalevskii]